LAGPGRRFSNSYSRAGSAKQLLTIQFLAVLAIHRGNSPLRAPDAPKIFGLPDANTAHFPRRVFLEWADVEVSENCVLVCHLNEIVVVSPCQYFVERFGAPHDPEKAMRTHRPEDLLSVSGVDGESRMHTKARAV